VRASWIEKDSIGWEVHDATLEPVGDFGRPGPSILQRSVVIAVRLQRVPERLERPSQR